MYTKDHANKAVRRHERRTVQERLTLLRAVLCSAAFDSEPTFKGDNEDGTPYQGPTVAEAMCDMVGYFLYGKLPLGHALDLIRAGYWRASEHEYTMRKMWEENKEQEQ